MKPNLQQIDGIWWCTGAGRMRNGLTPEHAYLRWEAM
jgi:hypothetical protein